MKKILFAIFIVLAFFILPNKVNAQEIDNLDAPNTERVIREALAGVCAGDYNCAVQKGADYLEGLGLGYRTRIEGDCSIFPGCTLVCDNGSNVTITYLAPTIAPTRTPTPTRTPPDNTSPCPPHGDVDGNGRINQRDVDEYNNYIAGLPPIGRFYESSEFADTNGDGRFDWKDRDNIVRFIAGSISTFPICTVPSPTQTPTPVPACGVACDSRDPNSCAEARDSCTSCINNTCQVPLTPTPVPACNTPCTSDSYCQNANDGCTDCNPTTNRCQVPLTPTPVPACNTPCTSDSYCQNANDGCTDCNPTTNRCQVPLTPTSIPSGVPSSTPVPTGPPLPTNTPRPTNIPLPTNTPRPTATPTPAFNPDSCKCDGIEYTTLFAGQPTAITSYGKVEGADVSMARIVDQKFYLYEGAETTANRIMQSGPIPATIESQTASKVRYKSIWQMTLPQLKSGATYRIQSVINCQPKTTAFNTQATQTTSVLAGTTQNMSLLDRILNFLNGLFGGGESTAPATTTTITPSMTPFTSADTSENNISANDAPTPTIRRQLQLEPIYPLEIYEKKCSFIKFRARQFSQ